MTTGGLHGNGRASSIIEDVPDDDDSTASGSEAAAVLE